MSRLFCAGFLVGACCFATQNAGGQQLLDRVLDRVQDELDNRSKPAPGDDQPELGPGGPEEIDGGGGAEPGYLGVVADDRQEQGRGVRVLDVVAGGPAAQGGLAKNDLITAINSRPIRSMDEMGRILSAMPAGTRVTFGVRRGNTNQNINVTLTERPAPAERKFERFGRQPDEPADRHPLAAQAARPKLGVRTLPVTAEVQQQFNLPNRDGAMVMAVTPGSPAERAGIQVGDVFLAIDGRAVGSPEQLAELVTAGAGRGPLTFTVMQNSGESEIVITLGNEPASRITGRPAPPTSEDDPEIPRLAPSEPAQDESRLEAMERRLQQLEDRIEQLEQALEKKT